MVRYRKTLDQDSSRLVMRIQKCRELMNVKIHTVIRDIMGKTGTDILGAIISGERDPKSFLPFIDPRIRAENHTILKSLEGNWRDEHLFLLEQCYISFKFYRERILICDREIERILDGFQKRIIRRIRDGNPAQETIQ